MVDRNCKANAAGDQTKTPDGRRKITTRGEENENTLHEGPKGGRRSVCLLVPSMTASVVLVCFPGSVPADQSTQFLILSLFHSISSLAAAGAHTRERPRSARTRFSLPLSPSPPPPITAAGAPPRGGGRRRLRHTQSRHRRGGCPPAPSSPRRGRQRAWRRRRPWRGRREGPGEAACMHTRGDGKGVSV